MIVRRYLDPFTEINAIRRQLNEAFGDFTEVAAKSTWTPAIRLLDEGDNFVLTAYLAGVKADNLDIQVTSDVVLLSGSREAVDLDDDAKLLYDDIRYGTFHRVINLPDAVQNGNVKATFNDGVLTLTLPKVPEARNKVVKVQLNSAKDAQTVAIEEGHTEAEAAEA